MEPSKHTGPLRVLIIGAGSAGLLLAQIFKKAGILATVFEQDSGPDARPRDWSFGIYWAQSRIDECLTDDLKALVDTVQTDPSYRRIPDSVLPLYHGTTGELLKALPAPYAIRLKRKAWLGLLRTGVDVRWSKKLIDIITTEDGVTARFSDGTTETGTLLIGCEGAHSFTRQWLFRSSPQDAALQHAPFTSFVTITKLGEIGRALVDIHPTYAIAPEPDGFYTFWCSHDHVGNDPSEWTFLIILTWATDRTVDHDALSRNNDLLLADVRKRSDHLAYPFRDMIAAIPRDAKIWYHDHMNYWPTKAWDNRGGRVTLAGDAAHTMTFHRGQGLGNAIEDVAELQTYLRSMKCHTREELAKVVAEYEKEVWKRGAEVVEENLQNTYMVHDWERLTQSPLFAGLHRLDSGARH